jgi:hypothetical protein
MKLKMHLQDNVLVRISGIIWRQLYNDKLQNCRLHVVFITRFIMKGDERGGTYIALVRDKKIIYYTSSWKR